LLAPHPTNSFQLPQTLPRNMADNPPTAKSNERISPEDVKKMDAEVPHTDHVEPGISIRMGPVDAEDKMDVDVPETNGNTNGKRKARSSITNSKSYKDASSSEEDDKPLVSRSCSSSARCAVLIMVSEQAAANITANESGQG
jgi:hypothetical protein